MSESTTTPPRGPRAAASTVDVLVVGSGTGMAAALAAHEMGLNVLVIEKTDYVGGSTAKSGGAFWIPGNAALDGAMDTAEAAQEYLEELVGSDAPKARWQAFLSHGRETVDMLSRTTPMTFFWARGYSDYHPELPGGSASGRTCECRPFDAAVLGSERGRLRSGDMAAPIPMPVTGADYKWMNLMARTPMKAMPRILGRMVQGIGGLVLKREYTAGGQALAAGMFAGLVRAGVPVWTRTSLIELVRENGRVSGAVVEQDGRQVTITARKGVILAAGGFDHDMAKRHAEQSPLLAENLSLGAEGNTGDAIAAGESLGATTALMDQAWWFPVIAPMGDAKPQVLLAERSLPGSLMIDQTGRRFVNEAIDYMSFGQTILGREASGEPVTDMWLVFDQTYRNSYVLAGSLFPRMAIPQAWYDAKIAVRADNPRDLAKAMGVPPESFVETMTRFDRMAAAGSDTDFRRGASAYDRYYGDPTVAPNPNLRPLSGPLYAVRVALSDLGTCGGLVADERARVLDAAGAPIPGLYAIGNTAANAFGRSYPGAGATIAQGLVFGFIAARELAG